MAGILLYVAASGAAFLVGVQALRVLRLVPKDRAERGLVALVLGYVLIALAILAVGLVGRLEWWALTDVLLLAALGGVRNLGDGLALTAAFARRAVRALQASRLRWVYGALAVMVLAQLVAALAPAAATDYDGVAEHLAQAKQYARAGRIYPLWYDHHSQFPSTLQMWYTLAHVLHLPRAAKLFHWGFGVIALLATVLAGRRLLGPAAGAYGALVLATTPSFAWLMGVAYVDLATAACAVLAAYLFCRWLQERGSPAAVRGAEGKPPAVTVSSGSWYLWLSALMAGAAAATKMQGLALLGVLAVGALLAAGPGRRLKSALGYAAIAVAFCWPWYLKSYLWTGNPVYPFAYSVFDGRMWSADRAEGYRRDQLAFGMGELPPKDEMQRMSALGRMFCGPRSPLHLVLAPVNLTFHPREFTVGLTPFGVYSMASIGPLYLGLLTLLLILGCPRPAGWLLAIFAPLWVWWLMSMQLTRYLLPSLALMCPAAGWVVARAEREGGLMHMAAKVAVGGWTLIAVALTLLYVLPQAPAALGQESEGAYLLRSLDVYRPSVYVNRYTPEDARIALYDEPRGYYLDRDYLWADRGHSALIRYETIEMPRDLIREYRRLGITHVMTTASLLLDPSRGSDRLATIMREAAEQGLLTAFGPQPSPSFRYLLLRVSEPEDPP